MTVIAASHCIEPCSLSTSMHTIFLESSVSSDRRLLSSFRSGCHGLRVDTGRWEKNVHLDRKDRLCLVCSSAQQVEDKHQFLFDCPAYSFILPIFFVVLVQYLTVLTAVKQMHDIVVDSLGTVFPQGAIF